MTPRRMLFIGLFVLVALVMAGCAGPQGEAGEPGPPGPAGPEGPAGPPATTADLTCVECHNDSTVITGKETAWSESLHGTGEAYVRGSSGACAGCHSGGAFTEMVAAGLTPDAVEAGDPNPTRQDCRACHQVHSTYTAADWALTSTDPVPLYAFEGVTFDGGSGNLCSNCHQPRRPIDATDADGNIEVTSTHWGPHHGPQSAMLLGLAGAGEEGSPSSHYQMVENTCVSCHLGEGDNHTFEPGVAACTSCHADAESFDINGLQTEVQAQLDELGEALKAKGLLDEEGEPVVGSYPAAEAGALWNWIYIALEDKSLGVHNPAYTKALLEASLAAVK
jgi:hypothetical protein